MPQIKNRRKMVSDCDSLQKDYEPSRHPIFKFGYKPYSTVYEYSPNSVEEIKIKLSLTDTNGFGLKWEVNDFRETDKI